MKLLLDTHLLLWAAGAPERLSRPARSLLVARGNSLVFSAASIWEIVIKAGLGRADFQVEPQRLRQELLLHGYEELPISGEHALALRTLPALHKDPFDRILFAQARCEAMTLVTADRDLAAYGAPCRLV
jgi:PIN domain nuclease of toxin-antitoxin system